MNALIDVTEVLHDPDFMQPLTLVRRSACTDSFGQNKITSQSICTVGCVQPISGKALARLPDVFRVANVQSFWIKQNLVIDSTGKYPDVIVKNGIRYTVQTVFDWCSWGAGWNEGTCVMEKPA